MTSTEAVTQALDGLRECFQADGGDLQVVSVEDAHATVRLVGTNDTCWECIVPPDVLRQVVTSVVRQACDGLETGDVEDPRV
jgi:Fe-S cluster biogenesis protein NfuA